MRLKRDVDSIVSDCLPAQSCFVTFVDPAVARIFSNSSAGSTEFPDASPTIRHAISCGRKLQDPLAQYASLCVPDSNVLLSLALHPQQEQVRVFSVWLLLLHFLETKRRLLNSCSSSFFH